MMRSSLVLFLFIIVIAADPTKAADDKDSYDDKHVNHSLIQPRQSSFFVNLDARSLTAATIKTPNFRKPYPSRNTVDWGFTATGSIELFCPTFELRPRNGKGKCLDYLEVECEYDGITSIEKYCGEEFNDNGTTIVTNPPSGIQCELTFKSSKKRNKRFIGFNCTVSSPSIIPTIPTISTNPTIPTIPTIQDCNCGVYVPPLPPIAREDKIVGGTNAVENQFPWQAVMLNDFSLWCGGSIINDQWILTAAHCTYGLAQSDIQILLGVWCANTTSGVNLYNVVDLIQHTGYNNSTNDNDIALLKLDGRIDFINTQFRPICLPIDSSDPIPNQDDVEAVISGFGALGSGGDYPNCLQYAIVPTMNNTLCQSLYSPQPITANMICAGFPGVGEIDSCQGDSGGPMATNATSDSGNYYVQIGVVSWGYGCADPDFPGVYTRVTEYIDWIHTNADWSSDSICPHPA